MKIKSRNISYYEVVILLALIIFSVGVTIFLKFGSPIVGLIICWLWIYLYCLIKRIKFSKVISSAFESISVVIPVICLLMAIGVMMGSWISCGTIATVASWGLRLFNPQWILPLSVILCAVFSLLTGTSYGSVGSIGVALVAIGSAMGVNGGMLAGAVICGSMFGDKLSPLSDTTNLAAAVSDAKLSKHVRSMLWNTIPTLIITIIIFVVLGLFNTGSFDIENRSAETSIILISEAFWYVGPLTMIPLLALFVFLLLRMNSIIALLFSAIIAGVCSFILQNNSIVDIASSMIYGYHTDIDMGVIGSIFNNGGLMNMFNYILIIFFAVGLGGMLSELGVINKILNVITKFVKGDGSLIVATLVSGYITSMLCCSQPLSHVLTAQIMKPLYNKNKVAPEILSRTIEDSGTLSGPLIPWHGYCLFMVATLGIAWIDFLPYTFFLYITPVFSIFYGFSGISIKHVNNSKQ